MRHIWTAVAGLAIFAVVVGLFLYFQIYPDREIARTEPRMVEGKTSCSYFGFCYGPVMKTRVVNGKSQTSSSYGYRYGHCTGKRPATFSVVTVTTDSDREWLLAGVRTHFARRCPNARGAHHRL